MAEQVANPASQNVLATVRVTLDIPASVAQQALRGTDWEEMPLGTEPDFDRESIGDRLDEWVQEEFVHLLDYATSDPEAECDW